MSTVEATTLQLVDTTSENEVIVSKAPSEKDQILELKGLSFLRFLLASSVIVYHYIHFFQFFPCVNTEKCFPSYTYLQYIFLHGSRHAVPTFWLVSGATFMKVYNGQISKGRITITEYALNRVSRLYPLHLVTLIVVAIQEHIFYYIYQKYFIYLITKETFIENLMFIQSWKSSISFSFNGPAWSVSTEIMVYFLFFLLSLGQLFNTLPTSIVVWLFFLYSAKINLIFANVHTNRCCAFFFTGVLAMKIVDRLTNRLLQISFVVLLFILSELDIANRFSFVVSPKELTVAAFSTVLFIYLFNLKIFDRIPIRFFNWFGNMAYAMYMLHVPVQLMIMLIVKPQSSQIFSKTWMLLIYISIVMVLSRPCYYYFEQPVQSYIRRKGWRRVHPSIVNI